MTQLATPPVSTEGHQAIDALEQKMMAMPAADCPLQHVFTNGLYGRTIFMPAGSVITSKIHKTQHQFVCSMGHCLVWIDNVGWQDIKAPHVGVTQPGTRRVLLVLEDTIWTTFHPTDETDVDVIESQIIEPHSEHLLGMSQPDWASLPASAAGRELI